jgi:hypothetical protein
VRGLLPLLLLAGCYGPRFDECAVRCGDARCPSDLTCGADGYCHAEGEAASCTTPAPDAAPADDAPPVSVVDAAIPGLDAACQVELLVEGGFESLTPWTLSSPSPPAHLLDEQAGFSAFEGARGMGFGGDDDLEQTMEQTFVVPAGATALELAFAYQTIGSESLPFRDELDFELFQNATEIATLATLDGSDPQTPWEQRVRVRVDDFGGRTLRLRLHFTSDDSIPTTFWVDAVSLRAIVCD